MPDPESLLVRLGRARSGLESAANAVPKNLWRKSPRAGAWSAAEVIAHVAMVEEKVTEVAVKLLREPPRSLPFWKRPHLPVRLAEWRGLRLKTPIPLNPALLADREVMLSRLTELRRRTTALLKENRDRDFRPYYWKHPFFGYLNFYDWFKVLSCHEVRHTKQLLEIVETFQK